MQIIPFDDPQELANLIRFRLASEFLEIDQFRDDRVFENMMAAADAILFEPERLHKAHKIAEADIGGVGDDSFEELSWIHPVFRPFSPRA